MIKQVFFTDTTRCKNLSIVIKKLPKNSAVIFREYHLSIKRRESLAREILQICHAHRHKIIIGKNLELARKIRADGVHFSDRDKLPLSILQRKNLPQKFIFSFACHNFLSVLKSQKLKADWIFLSPIFKTKSHLDLEPIGLTHFANAAKISKVPLFALGGINTQNFKILQKLGAHGFGAIEEFLTN